ncbi:MAG: hypothetical protein Q9195_002496 [Heterodermia aff. obscurata]
MSIPGYVLDEEPGESESVHFDRLCGLCTKLFDSEAAWMPDCPNTSSSDDHYHRSHHDIRALEKSANAGCHLCSLIFGQIDKADLEKMRKDLDEAFIPPYRQIGIRIRSPARYGLFQVIAWKHLKSSQSDALADRDQGSSTDPRCWSELAELDIGPEEQDFTHEERSTSYSNCSDATLMQIAQWMRECLTSHTKCFEIQTVAATRDILPLRLLDLVPALNTDIIKLGSSESLPFHTVYATLSHCWGGYCKTTLTTSSLATFQAGIHLHTLPKTFQDAVLLTRNLGIRYLWIDALCIVQDSNEEWSHEASLMGDIYANSSLTLSAPNSPDSEGGLYHSRSPLSVWPCRIAAKWDLFPADKLVVNVPRLIKEGAMEPLSTRGWAFQEWLLSKRIIHFSKDQVRWECHCLAASEVYPDGHEDHEAEFYGTPTKNIIKLLRDQGATPSRLWMRIREEYSQMHLSVATDKLPAFSGIARMVHRVLKSPKEDYIAGLWRPELLAELLWEKYSEEYPIPRRMTALSSPRARLTPRNDCHAREWDKSPQEKIEVIHATFSSPYIAPSWSWASFDGPFWVPFDRDYYKTDRLGVYAKILQAKTFPKSDDYGAVSGGFLQIRGFLYDVELASCPSSPKYSSSREWKASFPQGPTLAHKWSNASLDNVFYTRGTPVTKDTFCFIPILSSCPRTGAKRFECKLIGLLLENAAGGVNQYRRSGVLELHGLDKESLLSRSSGLVPLDSGHSENVDTSELSTIEIV